MHQCISSKEVIIRSNDKPWYDSEIRQYSRKRDRQKVIAVRSKGIGQNTKKMRNKVNNLKTHAKEQSHIEGILNNDLDIIAKWSKTVVSGL